EVDGVACGLLDARRIGEEIEILDVLTHPDYRRRGVARALFSALHNCAANAHGPITRIILEVREDNEAARALYAAFGYVPFGRRKNYYAVRDVNDRRADALLLERRVHCLVRASADAPGRGQATGFSGEH
ncbi:MAG: GNAT family N-acetyltransferase, partial [Pseudomonadota bacterium]